MHSNDEGKKHRTLFEVVRAQPAMDGDGVSINRLSGARLQALMNPFLLLDEINSETAADYIGGFPSHPHRGFETITYMKAGRMRHTDHMANEGVIEAGGVQWMTAGRGVIHSEMPEQQEGLLHGFQIWLNLPAAEKMKPAAYRDIPASQISAANFNDGSQVRVVAGEVLAQLGSQQLQLSGSLPALTTEPVVADMTLVAGASMDLRFNSRNPAFVFVYEGSLRQIEEGCGGFFDVGDNLTLTAGTQGAKFLLLSAKPIDEPIAQYGPFVMNARAELEQALQDFESGDFVG